MLNDITSVYDSCSALLHQFRRAIHDLFIACAAAASYKHGNAGSYLDYPMIFGYVVARIRFNDIRAELDALTDKCRNFTNVAVHHIAAAHFIRQHDQRLDHERHAVLLAFRLQPGDVRDALMVKLRLARK